MYFLGPALISGIGQVTYKYAQLMGAKYIDYSAALPQNDIVFVFALPLDYVINTIKKLQRTNKGVYVMTVCETETVHPVYGQLISLCKKIAVPSEFCKRVLSKQFPNAEYVVVRHWIPTPSFMINNSFLEVPKGAYTFYHIGNITDPRKQVKKIIEASLRLNLPNSLLLLKATCKGEVNWKLPNVHVINGLLTNEQIQDIHKKCDCYVSFSFSEGVGMGAVEAALNNKPVILPEYGGCSEYVKSPYTIKCNKKKIGYNDFLFTHDMEWGDPDFEQLKEFMKDVYEKKLTIMNHEHTHNLMNNVQKDFRTFLN